MPDKQIPRKLKDDAIVEALLEIRFNTKAVPEVLLGKLIGFWAPLRPIRLPNAEIPEVIRMTDPNLKFQPTIELRDAENKSLIRIGPNVLSYHRMEPYPGWDEFKPKLVTAVERLFSVGEEMAVTRIGLRYVNALTKEKHYIDDVSDLDVSIVVDEQVVPSRVNLSLFKNLEKDTTCKIQIATHDFVVGRLPEGTSILADVDVFTIGEAERTDSNSINSWIEFAHDEEKKAFFSLLTVETIDKLKDE